MSKLRNRKLNLRARWRGSLISRVQVVSRHLGELAEVPHVDVVVPRAASGQILLVLVPLEEEDLTAVLIQNVDAFAIGVQGNIVPEQLVFHVKLGIEIFGSHKGTILEHERVS